MAIRLLTICLLRRSTVMPTLRLLMLRMRRMLLASIMMLATMLARRLICSSLRRIPYRRRALRVLLIRWRWRSAGVRSTRVAGVRVAVLIAAGVAMRLVAAEEAACHGA